MNDPIVNEIRNFRDKHSKLFNYDLDAICDDFKSKHLLYIEKLKKIKQIKKITNISHSSL